MNVSEKKIYVSAVIKMIFFYLLVLYIFLESKILLPIQHESVFGKSFSFLRQIWIRLRAK